MFLIYGTAFIVVAGMIHQGGASSVSRHLIGSQAFSVVLAALIGMGMVTLLAFLIEFETQTAIPLQIIVAAALAAGGYGGIWFFAKRTPPLAAMAGPHPR